MSLVVYIFPIHCRIETPRMKTNNASSSSPSRRPTTSRARCHAFIHACVHASTTHRARLDDTTRMDDDDVTMMTTMERARAPTTTTRTDDDDDSIAGAAGRGGSGGGGRGRRERGDRRPGRGSDTDRRYREGTRDFERQHRPFRERAKTRPGWAPTGAIDQSSGRPEHSGQCEGCRVSTVVNFRPVVGGNPPLCGVCLDSLKAATGGGVGMEGDRAGGPHRGGGRGRRGGERSRGGFGFGGRGDGGFHPYGAHGGGQMVMVDPRMMAAYGGVPGAGGGKNRSWTRDGAAAGERDVDTSGIPCMFFQRGSCRAGDSCKYSHGGASDAVGGGDGDDAAMTS